MTCTGGRLAALNEMDDQLSVPRDVCRYAWEAQMSAYKNFTVDFPKRIAELDGPFRPIARSRDLEVSYTLMKLAASFLLPYERIAGTSGARRSDITDSQSIRKYLELDKRFHQSGYCSDIDEWEWIEVDDFERGPVAWVGKARTVDSLTHEVLETIRHSVAHSNLFFGGEARIEHIFLGSRRERDRQTTKYRVLKCTVAQLDNLIDLWIENVQKLRVSPSLIWRELEKAA